MKKAPYLTIVVLAAILLLLAPGCAGAKTGTGGPDIVSGTGTITYLNLEGGFYGIVGDDGQKYDPMNLDRAFQQDGLKVKFQVKLRKDVATIRMWGTPVEIISIEKR
ncbi:MAG: hypothetical protein HYX79_02395 [Chloroflexi bacterium]|nr:hypothetical protein [Chloroflexota bacterium]